MALHKDGVTLDTAAWPLHKNDIQDLRCFFFELTQRYGLHKDDTHKFELPGKLSVWPQFKDDSRKSSRWTKRAWPLCKDDNS